MNTLTNCQNGQKIIFRDMSPLPDLNQVSDKEYIFYGIASETSQICKAWRTIRHIQTMEMTYNEQRYKLTGCMPDIGQHGTSKFIMSIWSIDPI